MPHSDCHLVYQKILPVQKRQSIQATQASRSLQRFKDISLPAIISWALSEGIGIFGFILFFLGRNTTDLYILILIAALAMFLYRPKKEDIISLAEENQESPASGDTVT